MKFRRPSSLSRSALTLQTSGGTTQSGTRAHPRFFSGFLAHPAVAARGILALADIANSRFFVPMTAQRRAEMLDPVVTSDGERLRLESFSQCCGVYARYDLLPDGIDGEIYDRGTTNVDINPALRRELAGVGGHEPVHLEVGADQLQVTTLDTQIVEKKVRLPERWIRGFAEAPVSAETMRLVAEVSPSAASRFLQALPKGRHIEWVLTHHDRLRLTGHRSDGAVSIAGPQRLAGLVPLVRYATALRIFAPPSNGRAAASAWQLDLPGSRLTLTLSPELDRGFSGEGGVLNALSVVDDGTPERIVDLLCWSPGSDLAAIAFALEISEDEARRGLLTLGTSGRVGYDAAEAVWFHRELPWHAGRTDLRNPRLGHARRLVQENAIRRDRGIWLIEGDTATRQVRRSHRDGADRWSCSCPWYATYEDTRGPCKHVLAVRLTGNPP